MWLSAIADIAWCAMVKPSVEWKRTPQFVRVYRNSGIVNCKQYSEHDEFIAPPFLIDCSLGKWMHNT